MLDSVIPGGRKGSGHTVSMELFPEVAIFSSPSSNDMDKSPCFGSVVASLQCHFACTEPWIWKTICIYRVCSILFSHVFTSSEIPDSR